MKTVKLNKNYEINNYFFLRLFTTYANKGLENYPATIFGHVNIWMSKIVNSRKCKNFGNIKFRCPGYLLRHE